MGRKSAKIATRKGAADKARGQVFTRALKDVFIASKSGGSDPSTNFLLKVAVERCKKLNVPKDNIEKAIKKGQGSDGVGYEDVNYEGYGLGGIAVFVEASSNNGTRTVGNVRSYFNKCKGSLGVSGSLEFIFERKARFYIPAEGVDDITIFIKYNQSGTNGESTAFPDGEILILEEPLTYGNTTITIGMIYKSVSVLLVLASKYAT